MRFVLIGLMLLFSSCTQQAKTQQELQSYCDTLDKEPDATCGTGMAVKDLTPRQVTDDVLARTNAYARYYSSTSTQDPPDDLFPNLPPKLTSGGDPVIRANVCREDPKITICYDVYYIPTTGYFIHIQRRIEP